MSLREKMFSPLVRQELKTEWRSREISRIEGFSDAVFGFAVTLLIVALEVPRTSGELLETMTGFGAFVITFALLYVIWYRQFIFFRRYGLEDATTVALNGALIVVVLFFVYPLKFIVGYGLHRALGGRNELILANGLKAQIIETGHLPKLMAIYGFGFAAVLFVFTLMYLHAYKLRDELKLTPIEAYDTLESLKIFMWGGMLGLIQGFFQVISQYGGLDNNVPALLVYTAVLFYAFGRMLRLRGTRRKRREAFLLQLSQK